MTSDVAAVKRSFSERMLDGVERVGNKVPHPVLMFLYLILFDNRPQPHPLSGRCQCHRGDRSRGAHPRRMIDEHGGLGGSDVPYPETPDLGNYDPEERDRGRDDSGSEPAHGRWYSVHIHLVRRQLRRASP